MKFFILSYLFICVSVHALTGEDYIKFFDNVETTLMEGDKKGFRELFSGDKFIERMKKAAKPADEKIFNAFANGVMQNFGSLAETVRREMQGEGQIDFLKKVKRPKGDYYVFRLTYADGSLNYMEFKLTEEKGKLKASDVYIYVSGQFFSETLGNLYNNFLPSMTGKKPPAHLMKLSLLKNLIVMGKYKEAMEMHKSLPESVKKLKVVKILKMTIAMNLDEKIYLEVLSEIVKDLGDVDRGHLNLVQIDYWFLQKKYKKTLECIDALDKHLRVDPYLDYYRMNAYYALEDFEQTMKHAKKYIQTFEGDGDLYILPFDLGVQLKDHKKALEGLKFMHSGEFYIEDMEKDPEYKEFVNSKEYKTYRKNNKFPEDEE